jgi:hypothetical protein
MRSGVIATLSILAKLLPSLRLRWSVDGDFFRLERTLEVDEEK